MEENGLTTFLDLAFKTGVAETLGANISPLLGIPLFAPTNDAFADLDPNQFNNLLNNPQKLEALINYHTNSHLPQIISAIQVEANFLRTNERTVQETGASNEPIRYNKYGKKGEVYMSTVSRNDNKI